MASLHPGVPIHQHWSVSKIALSYLISVTGSYCTIQLMEQWRRVEGNQKLVMLLLSAVTLGGCGIWCTHFTGMTALKLVLEDGTILVVDFELGLTIISFIFPVVGVFIGLMIASKDPFFLEIEQDRRKNMLVKFESLTSSFARGVALSFHVGGGMDTGASLRLILLGCCALIMALFSRLWRIAIGGAFAALGVLGMHYLGMLAQRTNADMTLHPGIVSVSVVVAFLTANAAFWIIFRALTFLPNNEALRLASALIMGVAVCGTHYSGMGAASYTVSEENYVHTSRFIISGGEASIAASHGALLVCYWLLSFSVVRIARKRELACVTTQHDSGAHGHTHSPTQTAHPRSTAPHQRTNKPAETQHQSSTGSIIRKIYITQNESEVTQLE